MDKRIAVLIQGGRKVTGTLRGFDLFLNLVVDDAVDESSGGAGDKVPCGMVVSPLLFFLFEAFARSGFSLLRLTFGSITTEIAPLLADFLRRSLTSHSSQQKTSERASASSAS